MYIRTTETHQSSFELQCDIFPSDSNSNDDSTTIGNSPQASTRRVSHASDEWLAFRCDTRCVAQGKIKHGKGIIWAQLGLDRHQNDISSRDALLQHALGLRCLGKLLIANLIRSSIAKASGARKIHKRCRQLRHFQCFFFFTHEQAKHPASAVPIKLRNSYVESFVVISEVVFLVHQVGHLKESFERLRSSHPSHGLNCDPQQRQILLESHHALYFYLGSFHHSFFLLNFIRSIKSI